METTIKVVLLAKKTGIYTIYIFLNLDTNEYIDIKQPPNFDININKGQEGYLTYVYAKEGDEYYNPKTETKERYKYTNNFIRNFVPIHKKIEILI